MLIIEQAKVWRDGVRHQSQTAHVLSMVAESKGETDLAEGMKAVSESLVNISRDIHSRFVEGKEDKPKVTRTRAKHA